MSNYKLFIDDERYPIDKSWVIARSSEEAIEFVKIHGVPTFISFDHDLGGEDTSMRFIKWLVGYLFDSGEKLESFQYYVHSQNPVGKKNIEGLMNQVIEQFN